MWMTLGKHGGSLHTGQTAPTTATVLLAPRPASFPPVDQPGGDDPAGACSPATRGPVEDLGQVHQPVTECLMQDQHGVFCRTEPFPRRPHSQSRDPARATLTRSEALRAGNKLH